MVANSSEGSRKPLTAVRSNSNTFAKQTTNCIQNRGTVHKYKERWESVHFTGHHKSLNSVENATKPY
eukprot:9398815-Alexandrium_andersonii.AAC.1